MMPKTLLNKQMRNKCVCICVRVHVCVYAHIYVSVYEKVWCVCFQEVMAKAKARQQ